MDYKIKVHIADDHKILIDGIIALLKPEKEIEIVGYSITGKQVVNWFSNNTADVLVLDINMPEMDGIEVLKALKQRNTKVKTIILSSLSDPKLVEEMIKLGANGFIDKTFANTQLISAVKVVFNGIQYISENITNKLVERYTSEVEVEEVPQFLHGDLTSRELTVLKLIAKEKSSIEIGDALNVSVKTVETHRSSLYKKLQVRNVVGLAMYAVRNKIV